MILGYFGIILFLTWEWVRFIKLTSISRRCGDAYEIERSRHPE